MRALLSVSDKTGLIPFARQLCALGFELVSTGGTERSLTDAGLPTVRVQDVTGFPEMLDGRVKTLHPHIHAGLLARNDDPAHIEQLQRLGIQPFDLLVSNLYPFEIAVSSPELDDEAKVDQIDIGGPAMVRAAAKNFSSVVVVTDPKDYEEVAALIKNGGVDHARRRSLAAKAFAHVSTYDSLIAGYLLQDESIDFPLELSIGLRLDRRLRYGENPQQHAAAYRRLSIGSREPGVLDAKQLGGPELSFNNLLDADAAWQAIQISPAPTVAIVKHTIPCGLATRDGLDAAFDAALEGDRISAFGGIVALNREVDASTAERLTATRFDIVIAAGFTEEALARLRKRKSLRILQLAQPPVWQNPPNAEYDLRPIAGAVLVQDMDVVYDDPALWTVVTRRRPRQHELADLEYAWWTARRVKSNAIVLAGNLAVLGVGAGQPNRLESVDIAVRKAGARAKGTALASDAFFPFADGLERAAASGISSVVQPGGSVRDSEVIAAADHAGIAMVFTNTRHFRH